MVKKLGPRWTLPAMTLAWGVLVIVSQSPNILDNSTADHANFDKGVWFRKALDGPRRTPHSPRHPRGWAISWSDISNLLVVHTMFV